MRMFMELIFLRIIEISNVFVLIHFCVDGHVFAIDTFYISFWFVFSTNMSKNEFYDRNNLFVESESYFVKNSRYAEY